MSRELYSDLYKDAMGFRPRGEAYTRAMAMSDSDFAAECDSLSEYMGQETARTIAAHESRITTLMADYAITRDAAERWEKQAEGG